MLSEKFEEKNPILDLTYNIGICINIVQIPIFANLYTSLALYRVLSTEIVKHIVVMQVN